MWTQSQCMEKSGWRIRTGKWWVAALKFSEPVVPSTVGMFLPFTHSFGRATFFQSLLLTGQCFWTCTNRKTFFFSYRKTMRNDYSRTKCLHALQPCKKKKKKKSRILYARPLLPLLFAVHLRITPWMLVTVPEFF